ncbi:MAG: hypothetical protein R3A12_00880 [Ignavibacteria bacterium]
MINKLFIKLSILILFTGLVFSFSSYSDDSVTAPPVAVVVPERICVSFLEN